MGYKTVNGAKVRQLYEPDPHLSEQRGHPLRVTAGAGAQPGGGGRPSQRLTAVELSKARPSVGSRIAPSAPGYGTLDVVKRRESSFLTLTEE